MERYTICTLPTIMELRITFEPGAMQSLQAASYFNGVIAHTVEPWLQQWQGRVYAMEMGEGPRLRWSVWSQDEWTPEELSALFVWLLILREDVERLQGPDIDEGDVGHMVRNWDTVRHNGRSFFLEEALLDEAGDIGGTPRLTMGVLGGRTVMLSTDQVMFTGLEEGLLGLSVAGRGSYLVEDRGIARCKPPLRKAS